MYASLQVHTDETISAGRDQVTRFYKVLGVSFQFVPPQSLTYLITIDIPET
jgi:hypothetical protein